MATKLPNVPVVIVGMGWAGGIIASELTKAGIKVVGLERGKDRKLPIMPWYMMNFVFSIVKN